MYTRGTPRKFKGNHLQRETTFRPMSAKVDLGLKVLLVLVFVGFLNGFLIVVVLTSLVVLVSLVVPMVFDIFKCTLDSAKRTWMRSFVEQGIHFTRVSMYKRLPCIIGFPLQAIPLIFTRGSPFISYFPV